MNVRCLPDLEPTFLTPHPHGQGPGQNLDPLILASMDVTRDPTARIESHLYLKQFTRGVAAGLQEGQVLASQHIVKMFALCHDAPYLQRRSIPGRLAFIALGGMFLVLAVDIVTDASSSVAFRLLFVVPILAFGAFSASFALSTLVAKRDLIAVRSNLRWRTAAWSEVQAIEPSHNGIVFELKDVRRLIAIVTAKSTLNFLPVRYDKALLAELRSRIA